METDIIIQTIDAEMARLREAHALLSGTLSHTSKKKRRLSPDARARIAAAQKRRWAKVRKGGT